MSRRTLEPCKHGIRVQPGGGLPQLLGEPDHTAAGSLDVAGRQARAVLGLVEQAADRCDVAARDAIEREQAQRGVADTLAT